MATVTFKGTPVQTCGKLPDIGTFAPAFSLVKQDLSETSLKDYAGEKVILNIFPSIATGVCAMSVKQFTEKAAGLKNTVVLCISLALPFAQARFCGAEGIKNVITASAFRSAFGDHYGVTLVNGPLAGLFARAVVIVDEGGKVIYTELVPEIAQEPDYDSALAAL